MGLETNEELCQVFWGIIITNFMHKINVCVCVCVCVWLRERVRVCE